MLRHLMEEPSFSDRTRHYLEDADGAIEDLLDEGSFEKTANWGINDHAAMVEKMQAAGTFSTAITDAQVANLATWFTSMPSEICMKLWAVISENDEDGTNAIRLHKAESSDGTKVSAHMVRILTGS